METGAGAARQAWARLAGLAGLDGVQVVVDAGSPLGRRGWIGILALDGTVTACVPRRDLQRPVAAALRELTARTVTNPDVVRSRLPPTTAVVGPAALFYPPAGFATGEVPGVVEVTPSEIEELLAAVPADEADESGLAEVTGRLSASRTAGGDIAAACGWRRWPNGVAHLSVLAHPDHRRRGHARRAAAAAIGRAIEEDLLPQWRARPPASRALARRLGLVELGAQLTLEPAR